MTSFVYYCAPTGRNVDATIINAPTSTKNRDKARDPEMHQTKKRNQMYDRMSSGRRLLAHAIQQATCVSPNRVIPDCIVTTCYSTSPFS
jgi:hypothetical protein